MHRSTMLVTGLLAASMAALSACNAPPAGPGAVSQPRSALLALARVDGTAPVPGVTQVAVRRNETQTVDIVHPDAGPTLFAEITFPPNSILFRAIGQPVCDTCTVNVTITTTPGVYGFTVTPSTLIFNLAGTPTVTFEYGTYGDLSIHDSTSRYPTPESYEAALALWYEPNPGEWRRGRNSTQVGPTSVASGLEVTGSYLIAAVK